MSTYIVGFVVCGQILRLHVGCFPGHLVCVNSRLSWTPWAILQTVVDSRQMLKYRKELGLCISRESSSLEEYYTTILLKCISHRMLLSEPTCDCSLLDCSTLRMLSWAPSVEKERTSSFIADSRWNKGG